MNYKYNFDGKSTKVFMLEDVDGDGGVSIDAGCPSEDYKEDPGKQRCGCHFVWSQHHVAATSCGRQFMWLPLHVADNSCGRYLMILSA